MAKHECRTCDWEGETMESTTFTSTPMSEQDAAEWKTLRVREDAYEEAREQKEEHGRTWSEQIVRPDGESKTEWTESEIRELIRDEYEQ